MRRIATIIVSILVLISLDYVSKQYAIESLIAWYISLFGEWIGLYLSYNSGVAFSLPIRWLTLQILTVVLIGGIIYHYAREEYAKKSKLLDAGYALILAWAISHAYERIFVGHVIDFIAVKYFAILNFADIFISIGAFCIISYYLVYAEHHSR
jgi:signal peptidase II